MAEEDNAALNSPEFLDSLNFSGFPIHRIDMKIGTPIMFLRNIITSREHCNGARYTVAAACTRLITARELGGTSDS